MLLNRKNQNFHDFGQKIRNAKKRVGTHFSQFLNFFLDLVFLSKIAKIIRFERFKYN
jgi:hypothetical protein